MGVLQHTLPWSYILADQIENTKQLWILTCPQLFLCCKHGTLLEGILVQLALYVPCLACNFSVPMPPIHCFFPKVWNVCHTKCDRRNSSFWVGSPFFLKGHFSDRSKWCGSQTSRARRLMVVVSISLPHFAAVARREEPHAADQVLTSWHKAPRPPVSSYWYGKASSCSQNYMVWWAISEVQLNGAMVLYTFMHLPQIL